MDIKPKLTSLGIQCNRDLEHSKNDILKQRANQNNQTSEQISLDFHPVVITAQMEMKKNPTLSQVSQMIVNQ